MLKLRIRLVYLGFVLRSLGSTHPCKRVWSKSARAGREIFKLTLDPIALGYKFTVFNKKHEYIYLARSARLQFGPKFLKFSIINIYSFAIFKNIVFPKDV